MGVNGSQRNGLIAPLITTAAGLGIVQGLIWFIMSLLSILLYEKAITTVNPDNILAHIGGLLYERFLNKDNSADGTLMIIGPKEFNYFMYFYLVFSLALFVISSVVFWAAVTGKSARYYEHRLWTWTINMIILSLLDLILVCLISHDYHQYNKSILIPMAEATIVLVVNGIVLTLAARGFVIWIINVTFIIIFGKHLYDLLNNKRERKPDQSILDAYTTGSRPPWEMPSSPYGDTNRSGQNNKAFIDDNDNPMLISSSRSFTHLPLNDRDNYGNRDSRNNQKGQNPYGNYGGQNSNRNPNDNGPYGLSGNNSPLRPVSQVDRSSDGPKQWGQPTPFKVAKIGRQSGQRSPPLNVNPPFIPDPDYSPPGSPRVRGVLRPKSNYAMY